MRWRYYCTIIFLVVAPILVSSFTMYIPLTNCGNRVSYIPFPSKEVCSASFPRIGYN